MNDNKTPRTNALLVSGLLLGATFALVAAAAPVSAHDCISEDHSGCDAHDCPDDGQVHNHEHNVHWWRNHSCHSAPSCSATSEASLPGQDEECQDLEVSLENPLADVVPLDQMLPV